MGRAGWRRLAVLLPALFHDIQVDSVLQKIRLMRRSIFSQYEILNTTLRNEIRKPLISNENKYVLYKTEEMEKLFYKT